MKRIIYLTICLLALACSKGGSDNPLPQPQAPDAEPDDENMAPTIPELIFPEKDQLCLDVGLTFDWSDATDPDGGVLTYQIQISTNRSFTDTVEDQVVNGTSLSLIMEKGQDYYWRVLAIDSNNLKGNFSPSSAFYVEGEATNNYIPFSPSLTNPEQNSEVAPANVNLQWEGSDLDNDFLRYDIYLGTDENPGLLEADLTENNLEVILQANQTYYWLVHVSDGTAKSIGEIWSFRTN